MKKRRKRERREAKKYLVQPEYSDSDSNSDDSSDNDDWDDWDDEDGGDTGNEALSNELGWFVHRLHIGLGGTIAEEEDKIGFMRNTPSLSINTQNNNNNNNNSGNNNQNVIINSTEDGLHALSFVSGRDMEVLLWSLQIHNLQ